MHLSFYINYASCDELKINGDQHEKEYTLGAGEKTLKLVQFEIVFTVLFVN